MGRHRGKGRGPPRRPTDSPQDPATHPSVHMATRRESRTGTDPHSHADESKRGPQCVSTTKGGASSLRKEGNANPCHSADGPGARRTTRIRQTWRDRYCVVPRTRYREHEQPDSADRKENRGAQGRGGSGEGPFDGDEGQSRR